MAYKLVLKEINAFRNDIDSIHTTETIEWSGFQVLIFEETINTTPVFNTVYLGPEEQTKYEYVTYVHKKQGMVKKHQQLAFRLFIEKFPKEFKNKEIKYVAHNVKFDFVKLLLKKINKNEPELLKGIMIDFIPEQMSLEEEDIIKHGFSFENVIPKGNESLRIGNSFHPFIKFANFE